LATNKTLLDLLVELQTLDRVPRMGYSLRGVAEPESVTEHSWHLLFLVWTLAERIPEVNTQRAIELALIHDLAEVRTGDLPKTVSGFFPDGAKAAAETAILRELLAPLPERVVGLHQEYSAAETAEARLVKACDKLQLMIKVHAYQRWGSRGLAEFWDNPANFPDAGFEPVRELVATLKARHREHLQGRRGLPADEQP
jgi:putative hydrolase of HD superfamily